jgi:hypothetical protein
VFEANVSPTEAIPSIGYRGAMFLQNPLHPIGQVEHGLRIASYIEFQPIDFGKSAQAITMARGFCPCSARF